MFGDRVSIGRLSCSNPEAEADSPTRGETAGLAYSIVFTQALDSAGLLLAQILLKQLVSQVVCRLTLSSPEKKKVIDNGQHQLVKIVKPHMLDKCPSSHDLINARTSISDYVSWQCNDPR